MLYDLKKKALILLDETMTSGGGIEYLKKMNTLFDMVQKQLALVVPIMRVCTIQSEDKVLRRRADMMAVTKILDQDQNTCPIVPLGEDYVVRQDGEYTVEYAKYPGAIDEETPDSYELELCEKAQDAAPYLAAALCVMEDEPQLYAFLMSQYNERVYNIQKKETPLAKVRGESNV